MLRCNLSKCESAQITAWNQTSDSRRFLMVSQVSNHRCQPLQLLLQPSVDNDVSHGCDHGQLESSAPAADETGGAFFADGRGKNQLWRLKLLAMQMES